MTPTKPTIAPRVLEKLEWPLLIDILANLCHTEDGRVRAAALVPNLSRPEIEGLWTKVEPLKRLAVQNYRAPVGTLAPMRLIFRAAALGQMLAGSDLRDISLLLEATRKVHAFATDFASRCSTLNQTKGRLYPIPLLAVAINKAVGPEGDLLDDASDELMRIRQAKVSTRKRIEEALRKLLHGNDLLPYLQDDFWTVRNDRYVVPMRVDGRGRVKGTILDASNSGETLFIEPASITPINDQLQELDLEEKLEIARIFRELSAKVAQDVETLRANYDELIELDFLSAQAQLAADLDAGPVQLTDAPTLDLKDARHPLINRAGGHRPIGNSVALKTDQRTLIISGPNAGGKTVVLKTVGLLHMMARAGLLVPADARSSMFLFETIWLEMGDAQNLAANLSTFSGHLLGLKPILEHAARDHLVLLDELAVGTDPQTGSAIGTAILEDLADKGASVLVTTHFDALKALAINDKRFRNGSMEFSVTTLLPTYKLLLDVPGQSFGLEVAEQMGLPERIIHRAKDLRSGNMSSLDSAVNELMQARDQAREEQALAQKSRLEADAEKGRWEQEVEMLKENRRKASQQLIDRYEGKISDLRREFDELVKKLRQTAKDDTGSDRNATLEVRREAEKALRDMEGVVNEITKQNYDVEDKLPGQPAAQKQLAVGTPVFVLPLKKAGQVAKVGAAADDPVEVEVGIIKLRVSMHDLRILSPGEAAGAKPSGKKNANHPPRPSRSGFAPYQPAASAPQNPQEIGLTLQTATNSIDLRGLDAEDAVAASWNFIDRALLRGESHIILIHGHGTGVLLNAIRDALQHHCPYDVKWRAGLEQEGGNGVTVVLLKI